jgi:hypothetical protein
MCGSTNDGNDGEESVGSFTPTKKEATKNYSNSSAKGADEDLEFETKGERNSSSSSRNYDAEEQGLFSDDAQASNSGNNSNSSWQSGDDVPSVPVQDRNGNKFVDGKKVSDAEYDQAVKARSDFVDLASDPKKSKAGEDAFIAETMRSKGFNPADNSDDANKARDESVMELANYDQTVAANEAAAKDLTSKGQVKSNEQLTLEMLASGGVPNVGKDQQIAAAKQLGAQLSKGLYSTSGFITENIKDFQMYGGNSTQREVMEAIASGYNNQTGTSGVDGLGSTIKGLTSGLGGNRMEVDRNGNVTLQTQGQHIGEGAANILGSFASAYVGGVPGMALSGVNVNASTPFTQDGYDKFKPGGDTGADINFRYNTSDVVANALGSKLAAPVGKFAYNATNNAALAQLAAAGVNQLSSTAANSLMGDDASIKLGNIGNTSGGPAGMGVTPKGNMTSNVQSDIKLEGSSQGGGGMDIDVTDPANFNVKDGTATKKGTMSVGDNNKGNNQSNDDNGGGEALAKMKSTIGDGGDVNTLLDGNLGLTNPLGDGDKNLPAGVTMLNGVDSGFGNYLTKGKNRDFGSATFRTASRNEVNRNKRRSGIGNGILFG